MPMAESSAVLDLAFIRATSNVGLSLAGLVVYYLASAYYKRSETQRICQSRSRRPDLCHSTQPLHTRSV